MRSSKRTQGLWSPYAEHPPRLEAALVVLALVVLIVAAVSIGRDSSNPYDSPSFGTLYTLAVAVITTVLSGVSLFLYLTKFKSSVVHPAYTLSTSIVMIVLWITALVFSLSGWEYESDWENGIAMLTMGCGVCVCYFTYYSISLAAMGAYRQKALSNSYKDVPGARAGDVELNTPPRPEEPVGTSNGTSNNDSNYEQSITTTLPQYREERPDTSGVRSSKRPPPFEVLSSNRDDGLAFLENSEEPRRRM